MFDPTAFLSARGIEFKTARGNAVFRCPWCGDSDLNADNMGINLTTLRWGCWRNRSHGGGRASITRLLKALTGWTESQAREYLDEGSQSPNTSVAELRRAWDSLDREDEEDPPPRPLDVPSEFRHVQREGIRGRFWDYLVARKFRDQDIELLVRNYELRCCLSGRWANRLILPLTDQGNLMGWTGRAIGTAKLRYDTFPEGHGTKRWLFNQDRAAKGGQVLALVEGPMDALKMDFYGRERGVRSVAGLGTSLTPAQIDVLLGLSKSFKRLVIVLDAGAQKETEWLRRQLSVLHPRVCPLVGAKDPGAMSRKQIHQFALHHLIRT